MVNNMGYNNTKSAIESLVKIRVSGHGITSGKYIKQLNFLSRWYKNLYEIQVTANVIVLQITSAALQQTYRVPQVPLERGK